MKNKFVVWFKDVGKEDIPLVGGKGANLGELAGFGIPVPPGFIVTVAAYHLFLKENNLTAKIKEFLSLTDKDKPESYTDASEKIKKIIVDSPIPKEIIMEVTGAYLKLGGVFRDVLVAVRSSATAEDLPDASFAGQQRTFLNIKGATNLMEAVRECWASLFEPRAIYYREEKDFDHFKVGLAIPVQKMIQSSVSGVMFTCDPVTGEKNLIVVDTIYGLGDLLVQGEITPDHYVIDKSDFKIIQKSLTKQSIQLIKKGDQNKKMAVPLHLQNLPKLSDREIKKIAEYGVKIQKHYFYPQDIEFALDKKRNVYFVQTRPVTTLVKLAKESEVLSSTNEEKQAVREINKKKILLEGSAASPGIGWGPVKIIKSKKEIGLLKKDDILVTEMTTPDFVPIMKKASAIVTDLGGLTSHAAIVSREMGIPCVVGTAKATKILKNKEMVTVNGSSGKVYQGGLEIKSKNIPLSQASFKFEESRLVNTATKVYVNLADYSIAEEVAKKKVDGVGLLRAEFVLAEIGVHPKKIIKDGKQKEFIDKLAERLAIFCRAFNPRPVVYRATDFKTNEYRNLKGGELYEPLEPNPMLGFRGASRYIVNEDVFLLEIAAIKKVRNKMGLKNLWLMIPFVRIPDELTQIKKILISSGLSRTPTFQLWMMVEIPSNVILIEDFINAGIDGVSIGSNDLTMLILGTDRDNSEVAKIFDERNKAVFWAMERVIKACHSQKITCSICGQAPSEYPEMLEKLVEWGVTSVSVNPDAIERTREIIYYSEKKIMHKNE